MGQYLSVNATTAQINVSECTILKTKYLEVISNETRIHNLMMDSVILKNGNFSWKINVDANGDLNFFKSVDGGQTFVQRQVFN
jgi:hypothetical protein